MFATIIQSAPNANETRQTVVIAHAGEAVVYSRIHGKRGIAGSWLAGLPTYNEDERLLGSPASLRLTAGNTEDIDRGQKPESLLQNIQRKVTGINVTQMLAQDMLNIVLHETVSAPESLGKYLPRAGSASPVVTVVRVPEAEVPAPQSTPAPVVTAPVVTAGLANEIHTALYTPTREECSGYVERTLVGNRTERNLYGVAKRTGKSVGIWGHAGTGKTSSARHIASVWGVPFVTIDCNPQTDEAVIQGEWIPTGEGNQLAWRWSALAEAVQFSPEGAVILINEANRMSSKANSFFLRILQERRLQVTRYDNRDIVIPDNVLFIFDSNPGYAGTSRLDEALEDRFVTTTFVYDRDVESKFIKSSTLLDCVFSIRKQYDAREVKTLFTTRMVRDYQDIALDPEGGLALAEHCLFDKFRNVVDLDAVRMLFELKRSTIAQELGVPVSP